MKNPITVITENVARRASRDFTLSNFVRIKPTAIAIAQPATNHQSCETIGAMSLVTDVEANG